MDANAPKFGNLAASGIGTIDCIRHMMKHPSSVGDTQGGEAYVILVYAVDTLLTVFILAGRKIWTISFSAALRVSLLCTL